MRRYNYAPLSSSLYVQAAITAFFSLTPYGAPTATWRVVQLALAVAAAGVGVALQRPNSQARALVIGFEGLAVAVGVVGLVAAHVYIPGTIIAISVLIRTARLSSDAGLVTPQPQGGYGPPAGYGAPAGYGSQPYAGHQQFGIPPQQAGTPQYGTPQYGTPQYGTPAQYPAQQPYAAQQIPGQPDPTDQHAWAAPTPPTNSTEAGDAPSYGS